MEPPASGGLRIPTFFTPDRGDDLPPTWDGESGIDLDAADHTLVVVLSDGRMMRSVSDGTGQAWKSFFDEGLRRAPAESSRHYVFAIAIDEGGFSLTDELHMLAIKPGAPIRNEAQSEEDSAARVDNWLRHAVEDAALQTTILAIKRLSPNVDAVEGRAPIRLFLSHAKADLAPDETDPVRLVENDIKELPIDTWFDASRIPPSHEFSLEIKKGIEDSSIVVAFLSDHFSSRLWCQREILVAKQFGVPILVVDALQSVESRNFPYLGNLPTIRWQGTDPKLDARRVVSRAAREALRYTHNRQLIHNSLPILADAEILAAAPEALTLAHRPGDASTYYYPDPPLSTDELAVLTRLLPTSVFVTPLTKVAQSLGERRPIIATSISASEDLARFGLSADHQLTLSDEVMLYLLLAGCKIAYGGSLEARFEKASNFTLRLFELVRSYSPLAQLVGARPIATILNFAPWPLRLSYDDATLNLFDKRAELIEGPRPPQQETPESDDELFPHLPGARRYFPADTPARRLAWARGLTMMRADVTRAAAARVAIGGQMANYSGLCPGIVEEAWMSLVSKRPLFLVGAFGGATYAVIESLRNCDPRPILSASEAPHEIDCHELASMRQMELIDVDSPMAGDPLDLTGRLVLRTRIASDIANAGRAGLAAALNNGLDDQENAVLVQATEPTAIADLILTALSRKIP